MTSRRRTEERESPQNIARAVFGKAAGGDRPYSYNDLVDIAVELYWINRPKVIAAKQVAA